MKPSLGTPAAPLSRATGRAKGQDDVDADLAMAATHRWLSAWLVATVVLAVVAASWLVWSGKVPTKDGTVVILPLTVWFVFQFVAVIAGFMKREWARMVLAQLSALYILVCVAYFMVIAVVAKENFGNEYFWGYLGSAVLAFGIVAAAVLSYRHFSLPSTRQNFQ